MFFSSLYEIANEAINRNGDSGTDTAIGEHGIEIGIILDNNICYLRIVSPFASFLALNFSQLSIKMQTITTDSVRLLPISSNFSLQLSFSLSLSLLTIWIFSLRFFAATFFQPFSLSASEAKY